MPTKKLLMTGITAVIIYAVGFAAVAYVLENFR